MARDGAARHDDALEHTHLRRSPRTRAGGRREHDLAGDDERFDVRALEQRRQHAPERLTIGDDAHRPVEREQIARVGERNAALRAKAIERIAQRDVRARAASRRRRAAPDQVPASRRRAPRPRRCRGAPAARRRERRWRRRPSSPPRCASRDVPARAQCASPPAHRAGERRAEAQGVARAAHRAAEHGGEHAPDVVGTRRGRRWR